MPTTPPDTLTPTALAELAFEDVAAAAADVPAEEAAVVVAAEKPDTAEPEPDVPLLLAASVVVVATAATVLGVKLTVWPFAINVPFTSSTCSLPMSAPWPRPSVLPSMT